MKEFKLLKWYPSLPTEWKDSSVQIIVVERETGYQLHPSLKGLTRQLAFPLKKSEVEKSDGFWEEAVQLNVPIRTRFKHYSKDPTIFTISKFLDCNQVLVEWGKKDCTTYDIKDVNSYFEEGKWIKYEEKEPLFTTEDGKEIFEGDRFWAFNTHDWSVSDYIANENNIDYVIKVNGYKTFSNIGVAKTYMKWNKKLFSGTDIENLVKRHCRDKVDSSLFAEVRKLVNERV